MDRHAGGLIDDDHVIVLVHDADGLSADGRLVAVECVTDDIPVLDVRGDG